MIELIQSEDKRVALMAADKVFERAWGKPKEYDPNAESIKKPPPFDPSLYTTEELRREDKAKFDLALALTTEQSHLRLLPIAGAGALQNAKDVMFARGIDFGIVQTDVLDQIKRKPPFPGVEKYLQYALWH